MPRGTGSTMGARRARPLSGTRRVLPLLGPRSRARCSSLTWSHCAWCSIARSDTARTVSLPICARRPRLLSRGLQGVSPCLSKCDRLVLLGLLHRLAQYRMGATTGAVSLHGAGALGWCPPRRAHPATALPVPCTSCSLCPPCTMHAVRAWSIECLWGTYSILSGRGRHAEGVWDQCRQRVRSGCCSARRAAASRAVRREWCAGTRECGSRYGCTTC